MRARPFASPSSQLPEEPEAKEAPEAEEAKTKPAAMEDVNQFGYPAGFAYPPPYGCPGGCPPGTYGYPGGGPPSTYCYSYGYQEHDRHLCFGYADGYPYYGYQVPPPPQDLQ